MSEATVVTPRPELHDEAAGHDGDWLVTVWNNDHNTWAQVTGILQRATGCSLEEAEMETWEVHHLGRSIVHHAPEPECQKVADIIRTIGIRVTVNQL